MLWPCKKMTIYRIYCCWCIDAHWCTMHIWNHGPLNHLDILASMDINVGNMNIIKNHQISWLQNCAWQSTGRLSPEAVEPWAHRDSSVETLGDQTGHRRWRLTASRKCSPSPRTPSPKATKCGITWLIICDMMLCFQFQFCKRRQETKMCWDRHATMNVIEGLPENPIKNVLKQKFKRFVCRCVGPATWSCVWSPSVAILEQNLQEIALQ